MWTQITFVGEYILKQLPVGEEVVNCVINTSNPQNYRKDAGSSLSCTLVAGFLPRPPASRLPFLVASFTPRFSPAAVGYPSCSPEFSRLAGLQSPGHPSLCFFPLRLYIIISMIKVTERLLSLCVWVFGSSFFMQIGFS